MADIAHDFDGNKKISADEWRTIMVTGLRSGGQAYFALDVTSGQDFSASNSDPAKHLWEFTDDYDLGETWAEPSVNRVTDITSNPVMSSYEKNSRPFVWATYFGSGYFPSDQSNKESFLYGIEAYDASDLWSDGLEGTTNKVRVGKTKAKVVKVKNYPQADPSKHFAVGEILKGNLSASTASVAKAWWLDADTAYIELQNITGSFIDDEKIVGVPDVTHQADLIGNVQTIDSYLKNDALASPLVADFEGDSLDDRIYVGNLYGIMSRVDDIGKGQTPEVSALFTFNNTTANKNPIRAKADYGYAYEEDHLWVYWGTGRYENQLDKTDLYSQYFFGIRDWNEDAFSPIKAHKTYTLADLKVHTAKFVDAVVNVDGTDVTKTFRWIDGHNPKVSPEPWAIELFANQADRGWTGAMPAGSERVLVKPLVLNGMVFFVTFIPDKNLCAGNGESWLIAVDFETGLSPEFPVWDINGDGLYDVNDMVKVGTDGQGNDIMVPPNGLFIGRGQASHLVYHDGYLFFTTTGSGDGENQDGGAGGVPPNLTNLKVRLRSWRQGS